MKNYAEYLYFYQADEVRERLNNRLKKRTPQQSEPFLNELRSRTNENKTTNQKNDQ